VYALQGGVIVISIDWQCNLDLSVDRCLPTYSFSRLDNNKGSNFRSLWLCLSVCLSVCPHSSPFVTFLF